MSKQMTSDPRGAFDALWRQHRPRLSDGQLRSFVEACREAGPANDHVDDLHDRVGLTVAIAYWRSGDRVPVTFATRHALLSDIAGPNPLPTLCGQKHHECSFCKGWGGNEGDALNLWTCNRCGGSGRKPCDACDAILHWNSDTVLRLARHIRGESEWAGCAICDGSGQVEHPNGGVNHCPNSYDDDGLHVGGCKPRHLIQCKLDWSGMPVLADALEDAGCSSEVILMHCRESVLLEAKCGRCKGEGKVQAGPETAKLQPPVSDECHACANCGLVSGQYGHHSRNGWRCPKIDCPDCSGTGSVRTSVLHSRGDWVLSLVLGKE